MKTFLEDTENNKKVRIDDDGKVLLSEIESSILFRIEKHREFIKRSEETIINNVEFANIITDEIEKINERKAKIGELKELLEYSILK